MNYFSIDCPPLIAMIMLLNSDIPLGGLKAHGRCSSITILAAVMTDSPPNENLQYLSDVIVTADHSLVRFHGRNTKGHYWYNYLYLEQELKPWVDKVSQIRKQTKLPGVYFNNHYGEKAVVNALQIKAMTGHSLSETETNALEHAEKYLSTHGSITSSGVYP